MKKKDFNILKIPSEEKETKIQGNEKNPQLEQRQFYVFLFSLDLFLS